LTIADILTLLGMIPGIAAMAVYAEGILALVRDADLKRFLVGALPLVFVVGLTLLGRRMFSQMGR
jgi:phospholipase D1/2